MYPQRVPHPEVSIARKCATLRPTLRGRGLGLQLPLWIAKKPPSVDGRMSVGPIAGISQVIVLSVLGSVLSIPHVGRSPSVFQAGGCPRYHGKLVWREYKHTDAVFFQLHPAISSKYPVYMCMPRCAYTSIESFPSH